MTLLGQTSPLALPIGFSDYRDLRRSGETYVDKTLWIADVLDNSAKVLLVPRPRRFGKTLNLTMLRYFLEATGEDRRDLFSGTAIWGLDDGRLEAHFCRYPVIYLSFKDVKETSWDRCAAGIKSLVQREVRRLCDLHALDTAFDPHSYEHTALTALCAQNPSHTAVATSLLDLQNWLHKATGKGVVILIDEYDAPLHSAWQHGYWEDAVTFFRAFLSGGLKDSPTLFKGVLTGILKVAKEGIFSGLNHLETHTVLSNAMTQRFGFTEREVEELALAAGRQGDLEAIRRWYDGYRFGEVDPVTVYNPWSVLNFLKSVGGPRPFWKNTSDNALIRDLLKRHAGTVGPTMEALLSGESVTFIVDENVPLTELQSSPHAVIGLMTFAGYLTANSVRATERGLECELRIPNLEVRSIFADTFSRWLEEAGTSGTTAVEALVRALLGGDAEALEECLESLLLGLLSHHDLAGDRVEAVYQAFIVGLLVHLSGTHRVYSNREAGFGRADVLVAPKSPGPGAVLELKRITSRDTPKRALQRAVAQLVDRNYSAEVYASGATVVHQFAVVFNGKRCSVALVPTP
jgi:hypothetical protein